jgi:hypothetical protein
VSRCDYCGEDFTGTPQTLCVSCLSDLDAPKRERQAEAMLIHKARDLVRKLYSEQQWENLGQSRVSLIRADDGRGANPDELTLWKLFHPTSKAE